MDCGERVEFCGIRVVDAKLPSNGCNGGNCGWCWVSVIVERRLDARRSGEKDGRREMEWERSNCGSARAGASICLSLPFLSLTTDGVKLITEDNEKTLFGVVELGVESVKLSGFMGLVSEDKSVNC